MSRAKKKQLTPRERKLASRFIALEHRTMLIRFTHTINSIGKRNVT
jgi:hypothetical protein